MAEIVCRRLNSVFSAKLVREITQNPRPRPPCKYRLYRWGTILDILHGRAWTAEILGRYIAGSKEK